MWRYRRFVRMYVCLLACRRIRPTYLPSCIPTTNIFLAVHASVCPTCGRARREGGRGGGGGGWGGEVGGPGVGGEGVAADAAVEGLRAERGRACGYKVRIPRGCGNVCGFVVLHLKFCRTARAGWGSRAEQGRACPKGGGKNRQTQDTHFFPWPLEFRGFTAHNRR
jgi:hypothetical protein